MCAWSAGAGVRVPEAHGGCFPLLASALSFQTEPSTVPCTQLVCGAGDLNPGHHACAAGTFPMEAISKTFRKFKV